MPPDPITTMPDWHPLTVTHCCDGDTVRGQCHVGMGIELPSVTVRLLGIETWELRSSAVLQARQARWYLSSLVQGHPAYLHVPDSRRDRWGRWLGFIWLPQDGDLVNINRMMVDNGMAWESWPPGDRRGLSLPPPVVPRPSMARLGSTPT